MGPGEGGTTAFKRSHKITISQESHIQGKKNPSPKWRKSRHSKMKENWGKSLPLEIALRMAKGISLNGKSKRRDSET